MSFWSGFLGSFDSLYANLSWMLTPSRDRFFAQGYGDIEKVRHLRETLLAEWAKDGMQGWWTRSPPLEVVWDDKDKADMLGYPYMECPLDADFRPSSPRYHKQRQCGVNDAEDITGAHFQICDASFTSPLFEHLPPEVSKCHFRLIVPNGPVKGLVLHTAATNTEDYQSRQDKLAHPLALHGICSLMMIVPYYGVRRAREQTSSKLLTVADYQLQNLGVIFEGVAILRWLQERYPWMPLGVTGISWGGAMAACIGVTSRLPVACIPCLGSTSPAVMVTGIINWQLDWPRLMAERLHTLEEAKRVLEEEFKSITLKTLVDSAPHPFVNILSMVQVSARSDYYVQAAEGEDLYLVLSRACHKHTLLWVDGGHVTSFVRADSDFVSAVVEAFTQMASHRREEPNKS